MFFDLTPLSNIPEMYFLTGPDIIVVANPSYTSEVPKSLDLISHAFLYPYL
jgi:hypothetical protein